jgi:hypothetical protein
LKKKYAPAHAHAPAVTAPATPKKGMRTDGSERATGAYPGRARLAGEYGCLAAAVPKRLASASMAYRLL